MVETEAIHQPDVELQKVNIWYHNVHSRRVDIVGDYAGNELFLIEGDSILLHAFSDPKLDFEPGFQLLHATYLVENFLRSLVARKCNFHITFFDQHQELCIPPNSSETVREKCLLARAAIIRHLQVNVQKQHPSIRLNIFSTYRSETFIKYLYATGIYFIMCHDGAKSPTKTSRGADETPDDSGKTEAASENKHRRAKTMFRSMVFWFISQGYNAALVNGLEWRDTKVMTTILEASRHTEPLHLSEDVDRTASLMKSNQDHDINESLAKLSSVGSELSEREYLTVLTLGKLVKSGSVSSKVAAAFLHHTAFLAHIRIQDRIIDPSKTSNEVESLLVEFCQFSRAILETTLWPQSMAKTAVHCDLADLVDGRLLLACLHRAPHPETDDRFKMLSSALETITATQRWESDLNGSVYSSANGAVVHSDTATQGKRYTVLPFSNSVFDAYLAPINLSTDNATPSSNSTSAKIFREMSHWHNSKRPIDPKTTQDHLARTKKQQFYANRRNQRFMAEMTAYAASLTNAIGKALDPETVIAGEKGKAPSTGSLAAKASSKEAPKPSASKVQKKSQGKGGKQNIMKEIAAEKSRKEEASSEKLVQAWRTVCKTIDTENSPTTRYQKARQYLASLDSEMKRTVLSAEVQFYMMNVLVGNWINVCQEKRQNIELGLAASIFDTVCQILKIKAGLTKTILDNLALLIKIMKLPSVALPPADGDRPLAFNFALKSAPKIDLSVPLPPRQFQLLHCGPYFERSIDSAPDDRVPFEPDGWQRKVLDEIDAKRSLLVVAPTSAGKTFISFYAMKQVLESNDDDILIYVAPTKALVNQIAAEVQARFSKKFTHAGKSVWGIHTRDYRINNPTGCQILVTVPHILQIMLLAPSHAKGWSKRVKRIIFDEVHCIGQAEDGLIWEQLLLLAPCPIIALSATIGNPNEFNDWLSSTQKAIGLDLTMVSHPYRYSDLRKFVYSPPQTFKFEGLPEKRGFAPLGLDGTKGFTFVHPVASLVNRSRGMPDDLTFEARDCLMLWRSMSKHSNAQYPVDQSLDPAKTLPDVIKKTDIISWEKKLKNVLRKWLADSDSPFDAVFKDLGGQLHQPGKSALEEQEFSDTGSDSESGVSIVNGRVNKIRDDDLCSTTLPLLFKLHEEDALPALLFNYDRSMCEKICLAVIDQLKAAEKVWKESSSKWKAKLQGWEAWKKTMAKMSKKGPPKAPKKGTTGEDGASKADLMKDAASAESSPWESFDPEAPADGFHFKDIKKVLPSELGEYLGELRWRDVPEWQLEALGRGIGVHHAGMNRKYRQVVEILFRKGFLRVIIATGTLALGINMPCKTVVFSGDSVFLTALNFRQAAGRAGRRGFDMLGNVVFQGISTNKICRLISSRLPDLNGHFPITTTLVLRLFSLLNESNRAPFAVRSINALLSQPRLYLGGEESKMSVLHHLRFSIEYLRRQSLLSTTGSPLNFAGCVSHLYFTENSAFAFHALLKDGFFHELCSDIDKGPTVTAETLRVLMLTMAHLFGRQYCRQADEEFKEEIVKRSPSIVFLPHLPEAAAKILRNHNDSTLEIFTAYVGTFVEQHISEPDEYLPLTRVKCGGDSTPRAIKEICSPPTSIRSSFIALSGYDDNFDSIHDLCTTSRNGVFLEEAVIPYVGLYPEESDIPLNAYLYDFFMHGNIDAIVNANQIRRGDVWFVLNDFSLVLATIITSLSNFMKLTSDSDLDLIDVMGGGDVAEEKKDDSLLASGESNADVAKVGPEGIGKAIATKTEALPVRAKKKKVVESWDDDPDADESSDGDVEAENVAAGDEEDAAWMEEGGLLNVLKAFKLLREDFDGKFKAMWA